MSGGLARKMLFYIKTEMKRFGMLESHLSIESNYHESGYQKGI